jgi:hypothetical protein
MWVYQPLNCGLDSRTQLQSQNLLGDQLEGTNHRLNRDNGRPAERWSENRLYPYAGNTSSLGDCLKLVGSDFTERKAVLVFGYEHTPPKIGRPSACRRRPFFPAVEFEVLVAQPATTTPHLVVPDGADHGCRDVPGARLDCGI